MRLTVLVDDRAARGDLVAEHGLSLWIETGGMRILFDAGRSGAFLANADRLGVPAERADAVVVSHGHCDHTGGLAALASRPWGGRVFLHPAAVRPRFSRRPGAPPRPIGMPRESIGFLDGLGDRAVRSPAPVGLSGRVGVTGVIPRGADFEDPGDVFFLDPECATADLFPDDQALWAVTERGAVVVLGCAHAGVASTLEHASRLAGTDRIHAVVGGLHLQGAGPERLARTAEAMNCLGVERLLLGHCTGDAAIEFLSGHCAGRVRRLASGEAHEI